MDPLNDFVRAIVRDTITELLPHLRGGADELLDKRRVEAEYPIKFRIITDAARRDELVLEHAGRKPVVRRSVLEAWIASRRTVKTDAALSPRAAARSAVAARAAGGAR